MKKTIRKIEIIIMTLLCVLTMSGMTMQVYAGSADNSLESLTVAEGTLSPAFEGSRMYYTVQVGQDVSSVTVSAKVVNPAATIQSGVGTTTLKTDGDTKIDVVVQAENGNLATYHLTITKSATGTASDNTGTASDNTGTASDNTDAAPDNDAATDTDSTTADDNTDTAPAYTVSEDFTTEQIPADFTESQVTYQGNEYRGATFNNGNLSLLYMTDAAGNTGFYTVSSTDDSVCPYIRIDNGEHYLILMTPSAVSSIMPGSETTAIQVGDTSFQEAYATDTENVYTVYGMTDAGQEGWYNYNTSDGTYSEYQYSDSTEEDSDTSYLQNALNDLNEKYTARKDRDLKIIAGLIVVIVILIFVIINLLFRGRRGYEDEEEEEITREKDIFEEEKHTKRKKKQDSIEAEKTEAVTETAAETGKEQAEAEEKEAIPEETAAVEELPEEVVERLDAADDFMDEFEEEPEFMSGKKKHGKEKKEKKEKRRRSRDIFDDDETENGIFASHDDFIEKESSDDDIEVMDLNDL